MSVADYGVGVGRWDLMTRRLAITALEGLRKHELSIIVEPFRVVFVRVSNISSLIKGL